MVLLFKCDVSGAREYPQKLLGFVRKSVANSFRKGRVIIWSIVVDKIISSSGSVITSAIALRLIAARLWRLYRDCRFARKELQKASSLAVQLGGKASQLVARSAVLDGGWLRITNALLQEALCAAWILRQSNHS